MGRPTKNGLEYFQADVDMFQDRKIKRLLRSAGSKGFTIYIYLLTYIYRDEGYFFEWDEDSAFDISDDLNFSESVVEETIKACCNVGLFNKELLMVKSVLSSKSIQERWLKIVTDANRKNTKIHPDYSLLGKKPEFLREKTPVSSEETPEKSRESTQSKVKESKEYNYVEFVDFWNEVNNAQCRLTSKKRTQIKQRLKTFTEDEIKQAIENRSVDEWINGDGSKFKADWESFWRNDEKVERYLNKQPKEEESMYNIVQPGGIN